MQVTVYISCLITDYTTRLTSTKRLLTPWDGDERHQKCLNGSRQWWTNVYRDRQCNRPNNAHCSNPLSYKNICFTPIQRRLSENIYPLTHTYRWGSLALFSCSRKHGRRHALPTTLEILVAAMINLWPDERCWVAAECLLDALNNWARGLCYRVPQWPATDCVWISKQMVHCCHFQNCHYLWLRH